MQSACAILSSVACPAAQYSSTLSHRWHDFRGGEGGTGELLSIKCVFVFYTTFVRNISHSKKDCARYDKKNVN